MGQILTGAKEQLFKNLTLVEQELFRINDFIHANPELGNEEYKAVALLTEALEKRGFKVKTGIADLATAFEAELPGGSDGPTIAFVAEYDALPEIGHGCGHNIIAASALGAAFALAPLMQELGGRIKVIGTPAEDTTSEKVSMIKKGVFQDVDFAMQAHPNDRTMTGSKFKALHKVDFNFYGRSSHASRAPEKGISALDAVLLTFTAIEYLREHVRKDVSIAGIITHGGTAANSIPDYAQAHFIIRSDHSDYLKEVVEKVYNCARGAALSTGARLDIQGDLWIDSMLCVPSLDQTLINNAILLGAPQVLPQETMASSDFCNVSTILPSSRLDIAFVPVGTSTHSQEFADAGNSEGAHQAVKIASFAMAATAWELLVNPQLRAQVQAEHANLTSNK